MQQFLLVAEASQNEGKEIIYNALVLYLQDVDYRMSEFDPLHYQTTKRIITELMDSVSGSTD